jgi:hypothetical protein
MRVLTTGRGARGRVLATAAGLTAFGLTAVTVALALPASAGTPAGSPVGVPGGVQVAVDQTSATGVVLGPAVKYVREPDGTVRRVR